MEKRLVCLKLKEVLASLMDLPWVQLTWNYIYIRPSVPHVRTLVGSFWWRDVMSLSNSFRLFASSKVNMGDTNHVLE